MHTMRCRYSNDGYILDCSNLHDVASTWLAMSDACKNPIVGSPRTLKTSVKLADLPDLINVLKKFPCIGSLIYTPAQWLQLCCGFPAFEHHIVPSPSVSIVSDTTPNTALSRGLVVSDNTGNASLVVIALAPVVNL
jgi:hypothetical protein